MAKKNIKKRAPRKKGDTCRATKSQTSRIRSVCRKFGKNSRKCKTLKRRVC